MFLFIDTASEINRVMLLDEKLNVLCEKSWKPERNQMEKLLPAIQGLCEKECEEGIFSGLKKIIVVTGPGPFTSVRIGIATANALSFSLNIPVLGIKKDDLEKYKTLDKIPKKLFYKGSLGFIEPFYNKEPNITKSKNEK